MTDWHVNDLDLRRWVEQDTAPQLSASIELHLVECGLCVDAVAALVRDDGAGRGGLDAGWSRLRDAVEICRPSRFERVLTAVGLPRHDALLVASSRAFRGPLLVGVLVVLVFAEIANQFGNARGGLFFLAVAPILPSAAVALSYDPDLEPALEQELVTPYPAARLVVLRTVAVLALAVPAAVLLGLLMPGPMAWLWLLPAVGFVAAELALSTWISPLAGVGVIGAFWFATVILAGQHGAVGNVLEGRYRLAYLALVVLSPIVFAARSRYVRVPRLGRSWR